MSDDVNRSQHVLKTAKNTISTPPKLNDNAFIARIISADLERGIVYYTRVLTPTIDIVEGKAKLPVFNYGVGADNKIYGKFPSVTYNSLALLIRTQGPTSTPFVVALYPDSQTSMKDLAPISDLNDEDNIVKEVYPSGQTYSTYSTGNTLRTFNGWSFLYAWLNPAEDADTDETNFDDLLYDADGFPVMHGFYSRKTMKSYKLPHQAQNMALVHQSFSDIDTHRTAIMLDKYGSFESYFIDHSGTSNYGLLVRADIYDGMSIKRVQDYTKDQDSTGDPNDVDTQFDNSSDYSIINIDENNDINFSRVDSVSTKGIQITEEGTYIDGVLVASQESLQTVSQELSSLHTSFETLNDEISGLGSDFFTKLQSDVLELQNDYSSLDTSVSSVKSSISSLNSSISTIESNISSILTWQTGVNSSIESIANNVKSATEVANNNSSRLTAIEGRIPAGTDTLVDDTTLSNSLANYVLKSDYDALANRVTVLEQKMATTTTTTSTTTKNITTS